MAIMIVPMMMVQIIWEEEKYGARSRLAPSSTAITDMPEKNSVRYRNHLFFKMLLFIFRVPLSFKPLNQMFFIGILLSAVGMFTERKIAVIGADQHSRWVCKLPKAPLSMICSHA